MKIHYEDWNPKASSILLVDIANEIIKEYELHNLTLTLRQLYYQMVSRDIISNTERSYKNLGTIITKARNAGLLSWQAIEDRNRGHNDHWSREDPSELISVLPDNIRFDQWARQENYVEVWVEKEALGNVVEKACSPLLVPHMSCKGYLSSSEAWRAGQRLKEKVAEGKSCTIIHLGDHDPSGLDMTRDNQKRIDLYSNLSGVKVNRIALSMEQVDQYSPPPNPAKLTDSRASEYVRKYGYESWELDALDPPVLIKLIQDTINPLIDHDIWNDTLDKQVEEKEILKSLDRNWDDVVRFLNDIDPRL